MNKSIKIILLVVAILLAVGGVMAYYKTIVSPPGKFGLKNQYVNSDKKDIAKVKSLKTDFAIDSSFIAITHALGWQQANSCLTDQERDELLEFFATQYVPVYVSSCNEKYSKSVWDESELRKINTRIHELWDLASTNQEVIIRGEARKSLDEVYNVIVNYYDAKKAAAASGYNGLESAKQRIAVAQKYASMYPINNCSDLVSRLNSVPTRLERAHYSYLAGQVERLRPYYNYSKNEYENMALSISEKLDEYKKNAKSTYGRVSDISSLESRAGNYYSNATFNSNGDL